MICEKCEGTGLIGQLVCQECTGTGKVMEETEKDLQPTVEENDIVEESFLEESGDELAPASESEEVLPE